MHQGMATKRIFIKSTNERSRPILRGGGVRRVQEGQTSDGGVVEPLNDETILVSSVLISVSNVHSYLNLELRA